MNVVIIASAFIVGLLFGWWLRGFVLRLKIKKLAAELKVSEESLTKALAKNK